jgi:hypothetical protein
MSLLKIGILGSIAAVLSCGATNPPTTPLGIWRHPPSHTEEMWLIFCPAGKLVFYGGFLSLNPSTWRYDPSHQALRVVLGGTMPIEETFRYQLKHRPYTMLAIDEESRTLVFQFDKSRDNIDFGGYIFFREADSEIARGLTRRCS